MFSSSRNTSVVVAVLVLVGVCIPLLLYWALFGGIPTVMPDEAKQILREKRAAAMLVDVRAAEEFSAGHIDGANNWPLDDIRRTAQPAEVPAEFRDKTVLIVCDVGMASRLATWHLRQIGVERAINVRGGIQEWMRSAPRSEGGNWDRWRTPTGLGSFPFRDSPQVEQAIAVLSYFFIKPIYMLLSLVVVAVLWKSAAADLVALRWGMISFFLGEFACAVNYFGYKEISYLWEYLHGAGMFVSFGFIAYAALEAADSRILGLSDAKRRCAAARLCGACIKQADVRCAVQRSFYLLIPALMVIAMMIPTADWHDNAYNTVIFGQPYNYGHLRVFQQFEIWYCPAAALVMLAASLAILLLKRREPIGPAKIAFAAGVGPLGFGMLRMILGAAYDQNRVWFLFWEEATELLLIVGVCCLLWIFRRGLFPGIDAWLSSQWSSLGFIASPHEDASATSSPPDAASSLNALHGKK
jgi:rhodanese-related sulfurtransferase